MSQLQVTRNLTNSRINKLGNYLCLEKHTGSSRFVQWLHDVIKAQACLSSACWHFVLRLQDSSPRRRYHILSRDSVQSRCGGRGFLFAFPLCLLGGNWVIRPSLITGEPGKEST